MPAGQALGSSLRSPSSPSPRLAASEPEEAVPVSPTEMRAPDQAPVLLAPLALGRLVKVLEASPAPAAAVLPTISRPLRLPPAGRFRKENGGVLVLRTALPSTAPMATPVLMPSSSSTVCSSGEGPPSRELAGPSCVRSGASPAHQRAPPSAGAPPQAAANVVHVQYDDIDSEDELAVLTPTTAMAASPIASHPLDEQPHDAAVIIVGLGFLSLLPDVSGGPVSEVPLRAGAGLQASSQLWVASLSSDEDDDDEMLAPQTPLAFGRDVASVRDVVSGSVLNTVDVRLDEKVLVEPSDGLFVAVAALEDEEGWVQVGQGAHHYSGPSALHWNEGLERSLAFKRWARGRCFRCLELGHQVRTCRGPYRCIR
jgi:hypothetical protein